MIKVLFEDFVVCVRVRVRVRVRACVRDCNHCARDSSD